MPRLVVIKGCGPMVCSTYAEMTAEVDRAFASPPARAFPTAEIFASLAAGVKPVPHPPETSRKPEEEILP